MNNAMAVADKEHQLLGTMAADDLKRDRKMAVVMNRTADVCVLVLCLSTYQTRTG